MVTRFQVGIHCPNLRYALQILATPEVPRNIDMAKVDLAWRQAMIDELPALKRNHTWTLVPKS